MRPVSTCSAWKPGGVASTRRRLRPRRPVPASRTKPIAICAMMKPCLTRWAALLTVPPRVSECRMCASWPWMLNQTTGTARAIPTATDAARAAAATRPSNTMSGTERKLVGPRTDRRRTPTAPPAIPSRPPHTARSVVSSRTSRAMWRRLAPRACRTASSLARPLARMRSRLARFTPPMTSRKSTEPWSSRRMGRISRTWSSWRERTIVLNPAATMTSFANGSSLYQLVVEGVHLRLRDGEAGPRREARDELAVVGVAPVQPAVVLVRGVRDVELGLA
jgi:hypothetical protein